MTEDYSKLLVTVGLPSIFISVTNQ